MLDDIEDLASAYLPHPFDFESSKFCYKTTTIQNMDNTDLIENYFISIRHVLLSLSSFIEGTPIKQANIIKFKVLGHVCRIYTNFLKEIKHRTLIFSGIGHKIFISKIRIPANRNLTGQIFNDYKRHKYKIAIDKYIY